MVRLHVKKGDTSHFLYDTSVGSGSSEVIGEVLEIYNGRLKVERVCYEMEELAKQGTSLPPQMQGLTEEQVEELKLVDEWGEICVPSGGYEEGEGKDPMGRRNGKRPRKEMGDVLRKAVKEVKDAISKKLVDAGTPLTLDKVKEQLQILKGACMIVYPMNLPPHDPIRMEFENREELEGTHDSLEVIYPDDVELWFCGKKILPGKKLGDFIGKNDKTKVVVKISKKGSGPPGREPVMTEEQRKQLMMAAYKRQQEMKVFNILVSLILLIMIQKR